MTVVCIEIGGGGSYWLSAIYALSIFIACLIALIYHDAYVRMKKDRHIRNVSWMFCGIAFDSGWSMIFVYMFLVGTLVVPAYLMIVPQIVMVMLMINFYWSTQYKEGEAPSLRKYLMSKIKKRRNTFLSKKEE